MYQTADANAVYWRSEIQEWLPRILSALAILLIAWLLARAAKWAIARLVDKVPALKRHSEAEPGQSVGALIGDVAFWLILLVGILLALQPLGLSQVLEPVRELTTNTFAFIPNILAAGLLFFLGLVCAKIVRRIVEGALLAVNADRWLQKSGLVDSAAPPAPASLLPDDVPVTPSPRTASISRSIGLVAFFLVIIPFTIAALEALRIQSISGPATEMLRTILDAIPAVLGAAALVAIGYFVGRLAKSFVEQLLPSMGFDRAVGALGFSPSSTTPSRTVGTLLMIAILLFFAIKAAELLQSPIIALMLAQVLELGSKVLFGAFIILAGVLIARMVASLVTASGSEGWLPAILRWSIIALSTAMGLTFMGLANEIVIIAFASIIGSAAVACALAFGLGGRPTAHKLLERWTDANRAPATPRRPRTPTPPDDSQPPLV